MSTRTNLRPQIVIPAVAGNMTGNIISSPTVLQSLSLASYSYSWNGTSPVGTISIQVSNDFSLNANGTVNNPGTWITAPITSDVGGVITTANSVPLTGNSGEGYIEGGTIAYAVRTVFTFTSGTGTLQAIFNGKVT